MAAYAKIECPHCGTELELDDLYMTQMGKVYEAKNEEILLEAIRRMEEENDRRRAEVVRERHKMMEREIALQQRLDRIELEIQKRVSKQIEEIFRNVKKKTNEEFGGEETEE